MKKYDYIIAIDPDLHKSGIAIYNCEKREYVVCETLTLYNLFNTILSYEFNEHIVLLEYPNNTNTYHKGGKGAALNVGKNQAVAIIIKEFLEENNVNYKLLYPAGYSNLFKNEKVFKLNTNFKKRTNSDARAAAAMIYCFINVRVLGEGCD